MHHSTTTETATRMVKEAMTALEDEDINHYYESKQTWKAIMSVMKCNFKSGEEDDRTDNTSTLAVLNSPCKNLSIVMTCFVSNGLFALYLFVLPFPLPPMAKDALRWSRPLKKIS